MRRPLLGFAISLWASSALADPAPGKAHGLSLSPSEERRWIEEVSNHRTKDGVTVIEALRFAEQMRPRRFKIGAIQVVVSGGSSEPVGVAIDYFIGLKRASVDAFSAIFEVQRKGSDLSIVADKNQFGYQTPAEAIDAGRDALLRFIDQEYDEFCIDGQSHRQLC